MRSIHSHKINFAWAFVLAVALPQSVRASEPAPQIAVRFLVLAESDGTNAAASTKQIQEQVAVLRNDAARHGIHVAVGPTQFVEDSALRKLPVAEAARLAAHRPASAKPEEIVIYVTGLAAPNATAAAGKYVLLSPDAARTGAPSPRPLPTGEGAILRDGATTGEMNKSEIPREARNDTDEAHNDNAAAQNDHSATSAQLPAIVIDAKEFGGQGCGSTRAAPCRILTLALAEALSTSAEAESVRLSAREMKGRVEQAIAAEP